MTAPEPRKELPLPNLPTVPSCNESRRAAGVPYPRTCAACGFGPCKYGVTPAPVLTSPASPASPPPRPDPGRVAWEYRILTDETDGLIDGELNELGVAGWELVSASTTPHGKVVGAVFKRPRAVD